jgi:hypothetical protein
VAHLVFEIGGINAFLVEVSREKQFPELGNDVDGCLPGRDQFGMNVFKASLILTAVHNTVYDAGNLFAKIPPYFVPKLACFHTLFFEVRLFHEFFSLYQDLNPYLAYLDFSESPPAEQAISGNPSRRGYIMTNDPRDRFCTPLSRGRASQKGPDYARGLFERSEFPRAPDLSRSTD